MEPILEVKNVSVRFSDDHAPILHDISFSLERGESLAIIGPNGSGKTVLLRALLGSVPYAGEITFAPNIHMGYVPQKIEADRHLPINFKNLLQAKANVLKIAKIPFEELMKEVGLATKILSTPVGHLSGGQFQRCLIAFALLGKPDIILFDEPTASIDEAGEEQIYETLHRIQDELGIATIVVSHDLSFVYRYANKVLCINHQNVCFGTPHETLTPEILKKVYGAPAYYHHAHKHEELMKQS